MSNDMGEFWDERAEEDAFFFVDSRMAYGAADLERFWLEGEVDLDKLLASVSAELVPDDEVVEIGCGVGRLTRVLAARVATVRALDVSPRMLELAREHNGHLANVTWLVGDGSSLPVEDASADACVSHVVFQHIPNPAVTLAYVRDIGRVLRPGGWAAFQISNDPDVHTGVSRLRSARRRVRAAAGRGPRGMDDARWRGSMIELDDLRATAAEGGMRVERLAGEGTQYCSVLLRRG